MNPRASATFSSTMRADGAPPAAAFAPAQASASGIDAARASPNQRSNCRSGSGSSSSRRSTRSRSTPLPEEVTVLGDRDVRGSPLPLQAKPADHRDGYLARLAHHQLRRRGELVGNRDLGGSQLVAAGVPRSAEV